MRAEAGDLARPASPRDIFLAFNWLALQGFGGVLAITQRVLCEEKRWLTVDQFVESLAVAQVLPGPNVVNVALMVGDRFFGWRGAFAAMAGMLVVPLVLVLALTALYAQFSVHAAVAGALRGMGAVSAGLIVGTGLKLADALRRNPMGVPVSLGLLAATFAAVAVMRWPLLVVLPGLGVLACGFSWRRLDGEARA
jgi:chromate transporter